jgi:phosphomannomutase
LAKPFYTPRGNPVIDPRIFRAYDIRGLFHEPSVGAIDEDAVYHIAQAYVRVFPPAQAQAEHQAIVLGRDVRETSPRLWNAAAAGLTDAGIRVIDIGRVSTDMLYFTVAYYGYAGGMIISASHNPREYNGMKIVREKAIPLSQDSGIRDLGLEAWRNQRLVVSPPGTVEKKDILPDYLAKCLSFIDVAQLRPLRIVLNGNCGLAGQMAKRLLQDTPVEIVAELFCEPDGTFQKIPLGRPDPMIPANRKLTEEAVRQHRADLAVAWDADADRCFFFDEAGRFIEGSYITAALARYFLEQPSLKGEKVIHDPRVVWVVRDTIQAYGGKPVMNKCGHTFFKEAMRRENALFAGESSAHYYFRDFWFADNGLVPMLLVLALVSAKQQPLSEVLQPWTSRYFLSGEQNRIVEDPVGIIAQIQQEYVSGRGGQLDLTDGISVSFGQEWRFNLRASNTEPLVRLNVESRVSQEHVLDRTQELLAKIGGIEPE